MPFFMTFVVYCNDKCRIMKKLKPTMPGEKAAAPVKRPAETVHSYNTAKNVPQLKDLSYAIFNKTAVKVPFTQAEWASILHISERTLQRYAKNNGTFAPIHAERFYHICRVINRGKKVFGKTSLFYEWLHSKPPMLEGDLSFDSLSTFDGMQKVLTQLGRIEHGILA